MEASTGLDGVFDALANEHRRQIVHALGLRPWSISELAESRGLSLPAIHRHVKTLEGAGLVARRKIGRTNFLALTPGPLRTIQEWAAQFHPYWGGEQATFENYQPHLSRHQKRIEERE